MKRPYSELMEKANCVQYALAEKIYQLGRTDAIDECIDELREEHESWVNRGRPEYALATRFCIEDLEQLKLTP